MPEDFMQANFKAEDDILTVATLHDEVAASEQKSDTLQRHLLAGLTQSKVGIYSGFHEVAMYQHGYGDPRTVRMAHM